MKSTIARILLVLATATIGNTACTKDETTTPNTNNTGNNNNNGGSKNGGNSYTYGSDSYGIAKGEYLYADDDVYLFLQGSSVASYVQFIFPNKKGVIPVGSYTNNSLRYSPEYDVSKNFWGGVVTTDINPLGYQINGGTVTISQSGDTYTINFDITVNDNGTNIPAQGSYTGSLKAR
ncbi:MAG: hypothetical protein EOP51_06530 [Sphingobacteriales bacterium]|nr:MAG: hypothetical protein EOP51_06530 [Sphingobacteriales bacterium]